jgi:hypothetical protein
MLFILTLDILPLMFGSIRISNTLLIAYCLLPAMIITHLNGILKALLTNSDVGEPVPKLFSLFNLPTAEQAYQALSSCS